MSIENDKIKFLLIGFFICVLLFFILILVVPDGYNNRLTLFFSGVVALSTIVYAFLTSSLVEETKKYAHLTSNLVDETKKAREAQIEPRIAIYLEANETAHKAFIDTIIENTGMGPAMHIELIPDKDFQHLRKNEGKISSLGIFKEGIQYLSPKGKMVIFTTYLLDDMKNKINTKLIITAKYKDCNDKPYETSFILNYHEFENQMTIGRPPLIEIAENLEDIGKKIQYLERAIDKQSETIEEAIEKLPLQQIKSDNNTIKDS